MPARSVRAGRALAIRRVVGPDIHHMCPVDATGLTEPQCHESTLGTNGRGPDEKSCPPGAIIRTGMPGRHPFNHFARFIDVGCYRMTGSYSPKGGSSVGQLAK